MNTYTANRDYNCIDSYIIPDDVEEFLNCPKCKLKPKVWIYNNGRSTACGCYYDMYDHFSITAKSIIQVIKESESGKSAVKYNKDELKQNWNNYCKKYA